MSQSNPETEFSEYRGDQGNRSIDPTSPAASGQRAVNNAASGARTNVDNAASGVHSAVDTAATGAQRAIDKVSQKAGELGEKASQVGDKASQVGEQAAERIDSAMTATGQRMTDVAQRLRQNAPQGQVGDVAYQAAGALEGAGDYLQRADVQTVRYDLERVIRDHPIEALAIGLGIGFLLGKSMSGGSRRSYYG